MFDNHENFAFGTVLTAPSPAASGTTFALQSGHGARFPAHPFPVVAHPEDEQPTSDNAEILYVTTRAGDNFTVTRAQEGSSAKSIAVGWRISANITAKLLEDIEAAIDDVAADVATEATARAAGDTAQQAYTDAKAQASMVRNEVPGGAVNGSNTAYTTASSYASGSLRVYKNGLRLKGGGVDYTEVPSGFTATSAPAGGAVLLVDYEVANSAFQIGTNSLITDEVPSGAVNGSNAVYTAARAYVAGSLEVWVNGVKQQRGTHFTETTPASGTFTMDAAPATGSTILICYQYNLNPSSNADVVDGIHADTAPQVNKLYPVQVGSVLQVVPKNYTGVASGSNTIPLDDTKPQNTEGDQYMDITITPKSSNSKLVVEVVALVSSSAATRHMIGALFKDSAADALAAIDTFIDTANALDVIVIEHEETNSALAAITFKFRMGGHTTTNTTFNGQGGSRFFGATTKSFIKVTEVQA